MPYPCFSYPADVPPGAGKRDAGQASPRDPQIGYPCFNYPSDAPIGVRNRYAVQAPLPGLRRMPHMCFLY